MGLIGWLGLTMLVNALLAWTEIAFECRQLCRDGLPDFILSDPSPNWEVARFSLKFGLVLLVVQAIATSLSCY
jgi:hypothetical protein